MLIFFRPFNNPYLNIAAEEYFVKQTDEDICMIWLNEKSIIIGKHQNAYSEINYPFISSNQIPVIRRISGGGAVYHDLGNVNFTFIKKTDKANKVDFKQFTSIIIDFMQSLGIEVNTNKRNSLFIGDQKFSGHAEHIFHDKVLHHGTILFESELETLQHSLIPEKEFQTKAMASYRSEVGNIAPLLPKIIDIQQFIKLFLDWLFIYFPDSQPYSLTNIDNEQIQKLAVEKYKTWQWNFGYSPAYSFTVAIQMISGMLTIEIKVENGKIVQANPIATLQNEGLLNLLKSLTGINHKEEEIEKFTKNNYIQLELAGINSVSFSKAFFG